VIEGRGFHWGALLFTGAVGMIALTVVAGALMAPLPQNPTPIAGQEVEPIDPADARTPLPQELHSRWYTQSVPPVVAVGAIADVVIQFRNVGQTRWVRGSPSELRLGEIGERPLPDDMKVDWPLPNRPAVQTEAVVHENELATFSFKVVGTVPGTFRLNLRPVVDGVAWLQDEGVYVDITVTER
jgi:hypothetical protein